MNWMKPSRVSAIVLVLFGIALHTYTEMAESTSFSIGLWCWSLAPYGVGALLLLFNQPQAATGALIVPAFVDIATFEAVFVSPRSSTAALALLFAPLWNLILFVPVGGAVGWWIGRRLRRNAAPTDSSGPNLH